jgi:hypothetical protein
MKFTHILIVFALLVLSLIGNEVFSNNSSVSRAESQPAQVTLPSQPWQDADTKARLGTSVQEPRVRRSLKLNVEMLQTILRRAPTCRPAHTHSAFAFAASTALTVPT